MYTMYVPLTCSHINEDKRKTEGQMHMFEVLRDVEGCPVSKTTLSMIYMYGTPYGWSRNLSHS